MSNRIDLSLLTFRKMEFIDPYDKNIVYSIPTNFTTDLYVEAQSIGDKIAKEKDIRTQVDLMQEFVYRILSLDTTKDFITLDFIKERFNHPRILNLIILSVMEELGEQTSNPNSQSPKSTKKGK